MQKINALVELDELVIAVRERNSRDYIREAVLAYRTGLNRSAIVSTWTALVYDLILKIRELAVQLDPAAVAFVQNLENAIKNRNVVQLQLIESTILEKALQDFEFISDREKIELERLKDDRNICAHPAFTGDELLFMPSAEQVRVHIVHAIEHVLKHPPIQGRAALTRLSADILLASFPTDQDKVNQFLNDRYLSRAKPQLLRQMIGAMLSVLLRGSDSDLLSKPESLARCLMAIALAEPDLYEQQMREHMQRRTDGMDDHYLFNILFLCHFDKRCWGWTDKATRVRVVTLLETEQFTKDNGTWIAYALKIDELKEIAGKSFGKLSSEYKESIIAQNPRVEFADFAIDFLSASEGWRRAEYFGRQMIMPMAPYFTPPHVLRVLGAIKSTSQAWNASGMPGIMSEFFEITQQHLHETTTGWQEFVDFVLARDCQYEALIQKMTLSGVWPKPEI
jgi:hypothetical protein